MRYCYLILLLLVTKFAGAGIFTVVSPLDNGTAGTLRWAIEQANANGTATTDLINFNIPSGSPLARVIQLNSDLPILTSNIIIDGTTQVQGAPYGSTDAKIILTTKDFFNCKRGLIIRDASHVEIYGIYFAGFISKTPQVAEIWSDGIFMWNVDNITIGAPGKGNAFSLNYHCIRAEAIAELAGNPPPGGINKQIIIQNNIIGKNYTPATTAPIDGAVNGIELYSVNTVQIGGYDPTKKNDFMVFLNGVHLELLTATPTTTAPVNIINNHFIPGTSTAPPPTPLTLSGIFVKDMQGVNNPGDHPVTISHNSMLTYTTGISLANLKHPFVIELNDINLNLRDNTSPLTTAINIAACDSGTIGVRDSANIVHDTKTGGIILAGTKYVSINQNSIYCNPKGISIVSPGVTIPKMTDLIADPALGVNGVTCPSCIVEIFTTDECAAQIYNGKTLAKVRLADASGNWSYTGPVTCATSYTVTDPKKITSEFYTAYNFIIDTSSIVIQNATCGQNNGFVRGIKIFAGVDFHWEDDHRNIVGIDTNLVNVGPGFYHLVCTKQNLGCDLATSFYEIKDVTPVINTAGIQLIHPSSECGASGSITGIIVSGGPAGSFSYKWVNQLGVTVGTSLVLSNVPPGDYTLTAYVSFDPSCKRTAGPFTLIDKPAPKFNLTNLRINNTTCGKSNGSITGITITNPYPPQLFRWYNAAGTLVGSTLNLLNVPAGRYRLEYDDASPCPKIVAGPYLINNDGQITIDASNMVIEPSGCTVVKGSIKNIVVTGANVYEWWDVDHGTIVGNGPDLLNVPSGNYKLKLFDTNFGCSDSTVSFFIGTTTVQPLNMQSYDYYDETCTGSNGFFGSFIFNPAATGYTFKWVKNITDTFSNSLNVSGLSQGDFVLLAYDSNGCMQTVLQKTLIDHPSPILNESLLKITDDTCTQKLGNIRNISINGGEAPFSYTWYHSSGNGIAATGADLLNSGAGSFYLVARDKNGCADTSNTHLINDISPVVTPPSYQVIYAKRNTAAFLKNTNGLGGNYYLYDVPFAGTPLQNNNTGTFRTAALAADKDFWVERRTGSCTSARIRVHVNVIDYSKVFLPNAFTPNNDGLNDLFEIRVYGNIAIDYFAVFNRWGKQVFITNDASRGWDGKLDGQPQPQGTYTWLVRGYDIDGSPFSLSGTVSIIR